MPKKLPDPNSNQNPGLAGKRLIINLNRLGEVRRDIFEVPDPVEFGQVRGRKGMIQVVFPDEAKAIRSKQRRYRQPQVPRIQELLKLAYRLQDRLDVSPKLTRDKLARELKITPSYLTRILNLLYLAPEIQNFIFSMSPAVEKSVIVENRIKLLTRMRDHNEQRKEFQKLLALPLRTYSPSSNVATTT